MSIIAYIILDFSVWPSHLPIRDNVQLMMARNESFIGFLLHYRPSRPARRDTTRLAGYPTVPLQMKGNIGNDTKLTLAGFSLSGIF